jgi:phage FluMu protein Com
MTEFRCRKCLRLLCKYTNDTKQIEIICPFCRQFNVLNDMQPQGVLLQNLGADINCEKCVRFAGRFIEGEIETKCKYCNTISLYNYNAMKKYRGLDRHKLEIKGEIIDSEIVDSIKEIKDFEIESISLVESKEPEIIIPEIKIEEPEIIIPIKKKAGRPKKEVFNFDE